MTEFDPPVAQAGMANGKPHANGSARLDSSPLSKHTALHDVAGPDPLLAELSSPVSPLNLLKAASSTHAASKGKQPAMDSATSYHDSDYHKTASALTPIDETSTDAAFSYAYHDPYRSSANGYAHTPSSYDNREHVRIDSPDMDEAPYSPSTYPPTSEEDGEAKRVQQNLERWAAEERQRRKAQRTSKILATRTSTSGAGGLASRLSILRNSQPNGNNLGSGPSSERLADGPGASPSMPYNPRLGGSPRDAAARRGSGSSSAAAAQGLHRSASSSSFDSSQSLGSLTSDDHRPNRRLPPIGSRVSSATHARNTSSGSGSSLKGLGHAGNGSARDPFRDPSEGGAAEVASTTLQKRTSLKPMPTASRPIVTVGRASSIQRRALESGYNAKGKGKGRSMPTIVATDTEAEAEAEASVDQTHDENPFASSEDRQRTRTESSTTMIHEGGLDDEVALEMAGTSARDVELASGDIGESNLQDGPRPQPGRTSTSSSKFRELGITEGDDWIDTLGRSMGRRGNGQMRIAPHADEGADEPRRRWWTELLCGCSRDEDDDEQAGRTNPME